MSSACVTLRPPCPPLGKAWLVKVRHGCHAEVLEKSHLDVYLPGGRLYTPGLSAVCLQPLSHAGSSPVLIFGYDGAAVGGGEAERREASGQLLEDAKAAAEHHQMPAIIAGYWGFPGTPCGSPASPRSSPSSVAFCHVDTQPPSVTAASHRQLQLLAAGAAAYQAPFEAQWTVGKGRRLPSACWWLLAVLVALAALQLSRPLQPRRSSRVAGCRLDPTVLETLVDKGEGWDQARETWSMWLCTEPDHRIFQVCAAMHASRIVVDCHVSRLLKLLLPCR